MRSTQKDYGRTIRSCFAGYVVQSCICTLAPLLYVRFQTEFSISLSDIASLITLTFLVQLLVDGLAFLFVERIGYRICLVASHILSALGFILLGVLPGLLPTPLTGLRIAVVFYAIGAGLIEVLISPVVEYCPTQRKAAMMNLLHSFFAWGQVGVILLSTLFFALFKIDNWRVLTFLWALLPAVNAYFFTACPLPAVESGGTPLRNMRKLLSSRMFWLLFLQMICSGACELAVSQWASAMIETQLHVGKSVGDLAGPCLFAVFMGIGRVIGAKFDDKSIEPLITAGGILCIISYLMISLAPWPWLSLLGCTLCGLSVSVMWPSSLSLAAQTLKGPTTVLFAFLALGGDIGCTVGPTWAGFCADLMGDNLKLGILLSLIFPIALLLILQLIRMERNRENRLRRY